MCYILLKKFYLPEFACIVTYFANIPFFIYTFLLNCLHIDFVISVNLPQCRVLKPYLLEYATIRYRHSCICPRI